MGSNRRFSRRSFLTQTGAVFAALGLTELAAGSGILPQAKAYSEALAQSTGRKLALLIGIDTYPKGTISPDDTTQLAGAATDVALQKELLIHRFGFLPGDIICLTNEEATRDGIYQALVTHLCNQAGAKDTVVFHFSGYGAQIRVADLVGGQATQRSLVPYDGVLPTEERPILNDIFETELKTLLGQVKAKNITTVLDAGFVDITVPLSGGLRSRTRPVIATGQPPAPFPRLATQKIAREVAPFPGILLRGADTDDVVLERQWDQFNAGAFTYVLTQYLWSAPAPVSVVQAIGRSQETLLRWGGSNQQPTLSGRRKQDVTKPAKSTPIYDTPLIDTTRAEGVITEVSPDGQKATLWLGGIPPRVLEYLADPAIMTCAGRRLQVRSRTGLKAEARLVESAGNNGAPLQTGQSIFEGIRVLPKSIDLVVALDSTLERIERVDATSALSALSFVSSTSDTELPADCLLAKPLNAQPLNDGAETLTASLNPIQFFQTQAQTPENPNDLAGRYGYGLFSLTRSPIPGTLAAQEEAIKPAINRLTAKLQALLALKMLRLSENRASSQLPVRISVEMTSPQEQTLLSRQTFQMGTQATATTKSGNPLNREGFSPEIPVGSRIRYQLFNEGSLPLYYTLINVDPRERLSAFCPAIDAVMPTAEADATDKASTATTTTSAEPVPGRIEPGSSVTVPGADQDWSVEPPTGPVETYVVCSTRPLTNTLNTLTAAAANSGGQRISPLPEPLTVVQALLSDISQNDNTDAYTLNIAEWATLNFTYQAI
ncbi:MAG: caspase family protein [Cyanobacteria bacterium P01_F01_bin.53]